MIFLSELLGPFLDFFFFPDGEKTPKDMVYFVISVWITHPYRVIKNPTKPAARKESGLTVVISVEPVFIK